MEESEDFEIPEIVLEFNGSEESKGGFRRKATWKCKDGSRKIVRATWLKDEEIMVAKKTHPILLRVNHVNILEYLGIFINAGHYFTLTETSDCRNLAEYICDVGSNATDLMRINWMRQLASALIYLHTLILVNRDLKLSDMFLTDNYETLTLCVTREECVEELGTNKDDKLKQEVFLFINVLVNVMTNMKYSYARSEPEIQPIITNIKNKYKNVDHITELITRQQDLPIMEEVQFILGIDHTLELEYGERIGQGAFGVVFKAIWVTGDGTRKTVAAKKLNNFSGFKGIDREITILSQLQHTNIVSFLHITVDNGRPVIIMEYADCGSVYDYLHVNKDKSKKILDITQVRWMQHCANGLEYLHEKNILHRDLKTKNLVLTDNFQTLKICDFGLVKYVETTNTSRQGTYGYMAPEVAVGGKYTTKCDVFSFGIVLWEIMSKKKPSYNVDPQGDDFAKQYKIHNGERPNPDDAKDFSYFEYIKKIMIQCWAQDVANRPEMKDVLSDLCNDFKYDLEYEEKIGHGSFADVYKAVWLTEDGTREIVAVKKPRSMDGFKSDLTMLSRLKHENILSFLDIIVEVDRPVILMEYADHISVYHLLHNEKQKVEDMRKMNWIVQCTNGLEFLHQENVLHCDLKTKNLMLTDKLNLKICDFGLVNNFETTKRQRSGTNGYMAPEVCLGRKYTTKSDVFSFGIVLWEIMSGKKPLYEFESDGILQYNSDKGYRPKSKDAVKFRCFDDINSIMEQCWAEEEANRPTMKDVILHLRNTNFIIDEEFKERIHKDFSRIIDKVTTVTIGGTRTTVAKKTYRRWMANSEIKKFDAEVRSILHLNHTNVVSLLDLRSPNKPVAIFMEYADSGSLYDYLHDKESSDLRVIDVARLNWMIQCANGLAYLHKQNVLHGILNTRKMLLTDNFRTLKICDFGRIQDIILPYRRLSRRKYYIAPEVKAGEDFTTKCDVFQYGCVFWELMCDKMPIEKLKPQEIDIITGKRPKLDNLKYSGNIDHIKSIITQCWAQDKAERPTMQEVVLRLGVESQLPDDIFTRIQNVSILDALKNKFMSLF